MRTGNLHLIPVGLGGSRTEYWLPPKVVAVANQISIYIAENAKSARIFLKLLRITQPIRDITIHTLGSQKTDREIEQWLKPSKRGSDIALVSEAGSPAIADPGSQVVSIAHRLGINVRPWVGPCSITLGLMASGLDGQNFTFHGYAPIKARERVHELQLWEQQSIRKKQTQIFIETPYRNQVMFSCLLKTLQKDTQLCIAVSLCTSLESIHTRSVEEWKTCSTPKLCKKPTLFLFLAGRKSI